MDTEIDDVSPIIDSNAGKIKKRYESSKEPQFYFQFDDQGNIQEEEPVDDRNAHTDINVLDVSKAAQIKFENLSGYGDGKAKVESLTFYSDDKPDVIRSRGGVTHEQAVVARSVKKMLGASELNFRIYVQSGNDEKVIVN